MPVVIAWLMAALETTVGSIIISALLTLGISFVSYKFTVAPIKQQLMNVLSGVPAEFLNILGWIRLDVACTMVLSAYAARWAVGSAVSLIRTKSSS
ncbi:DUF2523 family protein [Dyella acidiphila]|uniref:DUF2523 domain-containing protein n=1 Tax=Dyella acidiphila TaxID=2775866 RepID=A0ABR9GG54_9GAMM|nr:DUF2523 family protein [Dyella acidiphila]MBE1163036.1 DUF2523 domain-containing protein [Dyella acidiphila]